MHFWVILVKIAWSCHTQFSSAMAIMSTQSVAVKRYLTLYKFKQNAMPVNNNICQAVGKFEIIKQKDFVVKGAKVKHLVI